MKYLFFISFILCLNSLYSQNNYSNWVFGDGAWINFPNKTTDPIFVEKTSINQYEGCTSFSDNNGELLFYSDGVNVWNRFHQIINNGTGLKGSWTSSQSAIIVPFPNEKYKFYIITTGSTENKSETIYYSVIDTSKGYINSEIVTKDVEFNNNYDGERVAVVKQPNKNNYWMILNDIKKPQYLVYEINENGITLKSTYNGGLSKIDNHGSIKISTNSNLIISPNSDKVEFEILRFNPFEGEIYDNYILTSKNLGTTMYGVEFSANSNFAYISSNTRINNTFYTLINQFDIIEWFKNKNIVINTLVNKSFNWRIKSNESLQLGPNNKIYVAVPEANYLNSIEKPDLKFPLCNFKENSVDLKTTKSKLGLPSSIINPIIDYNFKDTLLCDGINFKYKGDKSIGSYWLTPGHENIQSNTLNINNFNISKAGYYHFYNDYDELKIILKIGLIDNSSLESFIQIEDINSECKEDSVKLKVKDIVKEIFWSTGETSKEIYVKKSGYYSFKLVLNNGCSYEDSIYVEVHSHKNEILKSSTDILCEGDTILLNIDSNYDNILWNTGETRNEIKITKSGVYKVEYSNKLGCRFNDSILVVFNPRPKPKIKGPLNNIICGNEEFILESQFEHNTYKWIDENNNTISTKKIAYINKADKYRLIATNEFGCSDTSDVYTILNGKDPNEILINFGTENSLNFGTTYINELICKKFEITNLSNSRIEIQNISLRYKYYFSISPSQFPIILEPKETKEVSICFAGDSAGYYDDFVEINGFCNPKRFKVIAEIISKKYFGISKCNMPINFTFNNLDKMNNYYYSLPYPNPNLNGVITLDYVNMNKQNNEEFEISLYNSKGLKLDNFDKIVDYESNSKNESYEKGKFIFNKNIENGIYFILVRINDIYNYYPIMLTK